MRRLIVFSLLALSSALPPGRAAASTLHVDAGASGRAAVGEDITLEAHIEAEAAPVSVSWTSPAGCSVADAASRVTAARCSEPGRKIFAVAASDGGSTTSDTVAWVVFAASTTPVLDVTGEVTAGAPDEVLGRSGELDGQNSRVPLDVSGGTKELLVRLSWGMRANNLDLTLEQPDGEVYLTVSGRTLTGYPETIEIADPSPGRWTALVSPVASGPDRWHLTATASRSDGDERIPTIMLSAPRATPGEVVAVDAEVAGAQEPWTIAWERDDGSWRFDDGTGSVHSFVFTTQTLVKAKVTDARGFESVASVFVREKGTGGVPRPVTVVAVVDDGFSPYHFDFVGSQHPWNRDADVSNDIDLEADPTSYIAGHPGATPIQLSLPVSGTEGVSTRRSGVDAQAWAAMSSSSGAQTNLYWFPGTKIVGAATFDGSFYDGNSSHGTRSAASAAGNIHGTCRECLVVLLDGMTEEALEWAASQDWIDVVTNSYGHSTTVLRDNIYLGAPFEQTRAATEAGQTIVFSGGNGFANSYDVPQFTYWSSEKGPDWHVTVGAATPDSRQSYSGHGKPVDISSIGSAYPSTGGTTAAGQGTHSGTSNAAPVVAGTFAKVLLEARALLGDTSPQHAGGILATGPAYPCGPAGPGCVLGDGVLTRAELQDVVFAGVHPSEATVDVQTLPTTPYAYYYQGRGVLGGRLEGDDEWARMVRIATGADAPAARPAGEAEWFVVDSLCRQKIWGRWNGGAYRGEDPVLDPARDPLALAFFAWCKPLPQR